MLALTLFVFTLQAQNIFFEENSAYPITIGVETEKLLESCQSPYQSIDVYKTVHCGNMLVLDGAIQLTQWDNAAYHEMIAHVPLYAHPCPQKVLIIGGGDGGSLHTVLSHSSVQEVILCEIDQEVVRVSKQYFPEYAPGFTDPRVTVIHADAAEFIKQYADYFDVIIVDASDPTGPASVLYTHEFYETIVTALTTDGIVSAQGESPFFHQDVIQLLHAIYKKIFAHTGYYYALVPTYPSGIIGFIIGSKKHAPQAPQRQFEHLDSHYYTPEIHQASFILPQFLKSRLEK